MAGRRGELFLDKSTEFDKIPAILRELGSVQRRPSRAAEILAINPVQGSPLGHFPAKWLEFTSQVTELWACHADVQMDFSQSVKPADTLLENLKSLHVGFTGRSHRLMYLYLSQCSSGRK